MSKAEEKCAWNYVEKDEWYESHCGKVYILQETPADHGMLFCMFCGGELVEKILSDERVQEILFEVDSWNAISASMMEMLSDDWTFQEAVDHIKNWIKTDYKLDDNELEQILQHIDFGEESDYKE